MADCLKSLFAYGSFLCLESGKILHTKLLQRNLFSTISLSLKIPEKNNVSESDELMKFLSLIKLILFKYNIPYVSAIKSEKENIMAINVT
jgi:hypothetical protein